MTAKQTISKVLQLKGFAQEELETEVKKSGERVDAEKERLEQMKKLFMATEEKVRNSPKSGKLSVMEMTLFYDYLAFLGRQMREQEERIVICNKELEAKKNEMVKIYREKRIFEKFRDKIIIEEDKRAVVIEQGEADFHYLARKTMK